MLWYRSLNYFKVILKVQGNRASILLCSEKDICTEDMQFLQQQSHLLGLLNDLNTKQNTRLILDFIHGKLF